MLSFPFLLLFQFPGNQPRRILSAFSSWWIFSWITHVSAVVKKKGSLLKAGRGTLQRFSWFDNLLVLSPFSEGGIDAPLKWVNS